MLKRKKFVLSGFVQKHGLPNFGKVPVIVVKARSEDEAKKQALSELDALRWIIVDVRELK